MSDKKRMQADDRRDQLLAAALVIAERTHYAHMTREEIADHAGVTRNLVTHYFGTMTQFRRDIMRAAVRQKNLRVIAQGLMARDPHALKAPEELRKAAAQSISREV